MAPPVPRTRHTPSQPEPSARQALVFFVAAVVVLGLVVGVFVLQERNRPAPPPRVRFDRTLALSAIRFDARARTIGGRVTNHTAVPYERVVVIFDVIGADSAVVETVRDSVARVLPGGTWTFSIPVRARDVARVRVVRYDGKRTAGGAGAPAVTVASP